MLLNQHGGMCSFIISAETCAKIITEGSTAFFTTTVFTFLSAVLGSSQIVGLTPTNAQTLLLYSGIGCYLPRILWNGKFAWQEKSCSTANLWGRDRTEEVSVVGVHVSFYGHHYVSVNHEIREDYVHLCGPLGECLPDEWGHAIAAIVKTVLDLFAHLTTKMTDDSLDHFLQ